MNFKTRRKYYNILKKSRWCYIYLGYGYIHQNMIISRRNKAKLTRKPSNLLIWIITVYTALFTISFQRYENRINRVYTIFNAYVGQLQVTSSMETMQGFIDIHKRHVPIEPEYFKFWTTLESFYKNESYKMIATDISRLTSEKLNEKLKEKKVIKLRDYTSLKSSQLIGNEVNVDGVRWKLFNQTLFDNSKGSFKDSYIEELHLDSCEINLINNKIDKLTIKQTITHLIGNNNQELYAIKSILKDQSSYHSKYRKNKILNLIIDESVFMGVLLEIDNIYNRRGFSIKQQPTIFYKCNFAKEPIITKISGYDTSGNRENEKKHNKSLVNISNSQIIFYNCSLENKLFSNIDSLTFNKLIYSKMDTISFKTFELNSFQRPL